MGIKRLLCSAADSEISWEELEMRRNRKFVKKVARNWFA